MTWEDVVAWRARRRFPERYTIHLAMLEIGKEPVTVDG
jgi:hypothetical protein